MPNPYILTGWAWAVVITIWIVTSFTSKRTIRRQSIGSRLAQLCLVLLGALLISGKVPGGALLGWQVIPKSTAADYVGLMLTLTGIGLALWARFALGKNWSGTVTLKQDHVLVQSGPYRIVRHPIYSGFLLALLGTASLHGTANAFFGVAVIALAFRLKSLTEESFMTEQFGQQYTTYKHAVKALIPFVW
jgi:protein-S-isoprenylcysteine O-methyltransferase Ste14